MNLKCPICNQEFPKFDQRGFRNAGFTSHYNWCIERQKEQKNEQYYQGSSRASRFARAIRRRLLPAQHHHQKRLIPSIHLANYQTTSGSTLSDNGSSNSPRYRFCQAPITVFPPHILNQQQRQQQQIEYRWDNSQNRNHIYPAAVTVAAGLSSSFLFCKSSDLGSTPTTDTTPSTLCDRYMDLIHNVSPCHSLPATNYDISTTLSSSSLLHLSTNSTISSDIIPDTTISPSPLTAASTITESPMITTFLDQHHLHHLTTYSSSLSMAQDMLVAPYTIQTNTFVNSLPSPSTNLNNTPIVHPILIDYQGPLFMIPSSSSPLATTTTDVVAAATTTQLSLHDNLFSTTSSPILLSSPSGTFTTISSRPFFDCMNTNMVTTTNLSSHSPTPATIASTSLNINLIYGSSIQYCQYCLSINGYHLSTCSLMNYFMPITDNH
ncbi:hypothetical protein BJ944DRAFT_239825 [Cunninghamella echinulata]|nr:hypothetical protein BJ944DRAFT_239825 [Cunninghamella echinulata]